MTATHETGLPAVDTAPIQRATYRLQFNAGFRLADAQAAVPCLAALDISHLCASPLLQARAGSTHGCDADQASARQQPAPGRR